MNSSKWDKAYTEVRTVLPMFSPSRDLDAKIEAKEVELEKIQAELADIRYKTTV